MENKNDWNKLMCDYLNFNAETDWHLGYEIVANLIQPCRGKIALDYGCGTGKFTRAIRDLGAKVIATDSSENALELAKLEDSTNIEYGLVKNENLSLVKDESIDFALATFVLCTIPEERRIERIIRQIYSKLKANGEFIILEPHPEAAGHDYVSFKRFQPQILQSGAPVLVELKGMKKRFYDYWRSIEDYQRILGATGFRIKDMFAPIIKDRSDETFWKDELKYPPLLTIYARK
ncbi:MAG: class I SAM-dependent methyltransferase [archaeon]